MAYCGRITRFDWEPLASEWKVTIEVPLPNEMVDFSAIFRQSISGLEVGSSRVTVFDPWTYEYRIPQSCIDLKNLKAFLDILTWTVTISDDCDESHALYVHMLPHPTDNPYDANWRRTRMGNLVNRAKSYSPTTGSKPKASELAERFVRWIGQHPRYKSADIVIPAPPGNLIKTFDLPLFIAVEVSNTFNMELRQSEKVISRQPQKAIVQDLTILQQNISGTIQVPGNLENCDVVIIDDLYQSGATINELARSCRLAGASSVISLVATKTAKFCQGLTPSDCLDVSRLAAEEDV